VGSGPRAITGLDVSGTSGAMDLLTTNLLTNDISLLRNEYILVIDEDLPNLPTKFALFQNYPNPFNPSTTIRYDVAKQTKVVLKIYNILGQKVQTLVNATEMPGYKSVIWDGKNDGGQRVSSGVYIYELKTGSGFSERKKMMLLK
jgi:hypothetical protein